VPGLYPSASGAHGERLRLSSYIAYLAQRHGQVEICGSVDEDEREDFDAGAGPRTDGEACECTCDAWACCDPLRLLIVSILYVFGEDKLHIKMPIKHQVDITIRLCCNLAGGGGGKYIHVYASVPMKP
jgi:hypothetical protein